jgi:hypothetical protein
MLFDDHDQRCWRSFAVVAGRHGRAAAKHKAKKKLTDDGFRTLLADLATLTRNTVWCGKAPAMARLARPTEIQQRVFDLLGVKLQV